MEMNKIWWQCLVPTSTPGSLVMWGTEWPKVNRVIRKIILWTMTSDSLTENEEHSIPSQILKTIFGLHVSFILDPYMYGFQHTCRVLWSQTPVVYCSTRSYRLVSQMRAPLPASRELAGSYDSCAIYYTFLNIKRNIIQSMLHLPTLRYFGTSVTYP